MRLVIGNYYINRVGQTVHIVNAYPSGGVMVFFDQENRTYFEDGCPTSAGVGDDFRIVSEQR